MTGERRSTPISLAIGLGLVFYWSCLAGPPLPASWPKAAGPVVVAISIDGLRPDAWEKARTPHLDLLAARGASTRTARTVNPSVTLPAHTSMLTGVDPSVHHWMLNSYKPWKGRLAFPTIFRAVDRAGGATCMVASKLKFWHLARPPELQVYDHAGWAARTISKAALGWLAKGGGGFYFVHYGEVDGAGHSIGWMTPEQLAAVEGVDLAIGDLVKGVRELGLADRVTWMVTADHGGSGKNHGSNSAEDMTVPFIVSGARVKAGAGLADPVSVKDVAPTAAWLLGLPPIEGATGRVLSEAFEPTP